MGLTREGDTVHRLNLDKMLSWPSGKTAHDDGSSGYHRYPPKTRNLRVVKPPRHERQDRSILVTLNGRTFRVTSSLKPYRIKREIKETVSKRTRFAAGADYAETWQTSHKPTTDGFKGLAKPGRDPDGD